MLITVMAFGAGGQQGGTTSGGTSFPTGRVSYPIQTDVTLTYWASMSPNLGPNFSNYGDVPFYQGWSERTGVKVTHLHPPQGTENEQFNLLISSGDLPDIFNRNIVDYPGGPEKAILDGTVLRLNDVIDKYAPNLKELLASRPDWDRMVKSDTGNYYTFPNIRSDPWLCIWQGLQIRKDWLDELGLQLPETYDDWHTVLTAFKTRKNVIAPVSVTYNSSSFMYGYGFDRDFYIGNDGRVTWGRIQPAFREYLAMMSQWYREGLLDPDTVALTSQVIAAKITSGGTGAVHGSLMGNMGAWIPSGRQSNPAFSLVGTIYPVQRRGGKSAIIAIDLPFSGANGSVSVAGNTKHPEITARFLDWAYGQEGYMYHNFGTPGVSYNVINGYPTYTDLVLRNPRGWPIGQALASVAMAGYGGPHIQSREYFEQITAFPEQTISLENWTIPEPFRHRLPPVTPTPDESQELARIMQEINTYANEMLARFILGTEPLSSFDNYLATVRRMGIDRAIEIQNAALARYNAR